MTASLDGTGQGRSADGDAPIQADDFRRQRHHLRAAAALIVSSCERMLEDATGPDAAPLREAIGAAMMAGRQISALVQASMPGSRTAMPVSELAALFRSIEEPRDRIERETTRMLRSSHDGTFDECVVADLTTIRNAAIQLLYRDTIQIYAATSLITPAVSAPGTPVESAAPPAGVSSPRVEPAPAPARSQVARILVAEDSPEVRNALVGYLRKLGHTVEAVENGAVALERIRQGGVDLLLSDLEMPVLDGLALLTAVKQSSDTRDVPVVIISGLDDLKVVAKCIQAGADEHLSKPFDRALLEVRVNSLLERKFLRDAESVYLAQVRKVAAAAAAVEDRTYESGVLADVATRDDEIGKLARVFDSMAAGVKVREERLTSRVRALQQEVSRTQHTPKAFPAPSSHSLLKIGALFADRYEITEHAGEGGMGAVYRAHDRVLGEDVAVKTVRAELIAESPVLAERLKNELRLARRLTHRNIVRCHDFGESSGIYYLTMEFVSGTTVREMIDLRGRLSVQSTLALGTQLADALGAAHSEGVIHRDVKPANLLTTELGVLKVMDFGIARLSETKESLTAMGFVVGTPEYIAPERLMGGALEPRSDLYSMGVVLYECLTGRLPVEAPSPVSLMAAILTAEIVPPVMANPNTPQALSAIVMRLLEREPGNRPPDAASVAEALRAMA